MNQQPSEHQLSSMTSDNSTVVFNKIDLRLEFDFQKPLFVLLNQNPNLYNFSEIFPYIIYSSDANVESSIDDSLILGRGSFGKVYCAVNYFHGQNSLNIITNLRHLYFSGRKFSTQMLFAIKIHTDCNFEEIIQLGNEYTNQKKLAEKFPNNILNLTDRVYITQNTVNSYTARAVMEIGFVTLNEYINIIPTIDDEEFQQIYNQILQGILNIHQLKIAHRDIKPQNIVYVHQKGWVLADFGCSIEYKVKKGKYFLAGTKAYMPKEIREQILAKNVNKEVQMDLFQNDIYAFVITMLQIIYKGYSITELQQMIDKNSLQDKRFKIYKKSFKQIQQILPYQKQEIVRMPENNFLTLKEWFTKKSQDPIKKQQTSQLIQYHMFYYYDGSKQYLTFLDMQRLFVLSTNRTSIKQNELFFVMEEFRKQLDTYQFIDILQLITFDIKKWQYEMIYNYLEQKGQIQLLHEVCQKHQSQQQNVNYRYKLQEIDLKICLGQRAEATDLVKTLVSQAYSFDDISYMKFHFLYGELLPQTSCAMLNYQAHHIEEIRSILYSSYKILEKMVYEFDIPDEVQENYADDSLNVYFFIKSNLKTFDHQLASKYFQKILDLHCQELEISSEDDILKQLIVKGYDSYGVFMILYFFTKILSFIKNRWDQAMQLFIAAISYADEKMPNYPYTWLFYYNYAKLLLHLNYITEASEMISQAKSKLQYEDLIGKVKIELLQWCTQFRICQLPLHKDQFQNIIHNYKQAYKIYQNIKLLANILETIEKEVQHYIFNYGMQQNCIEYISLVQETFIPLFNQEDLHQQKNTKLVETYFFLIEMKYRFQKQIENPKKLIEYFNQLLIDLSDSKLLSEFEDYIFRQMNHIFEVQKKYISETNHQDIAIHHSKTTQQFLVQNVIEKNEDQLNNFKITSLSYYIIIMEYLKANDKVLEGQNLLKFYQSIEKT